MKRQLQNRRRSRFISALFCILIVFAVLATTAMEISLQAFAGEVVFPYDATSERTDSDPSYFVLVGMSQVSEEETAPVVDGGTYTIPETGFASLANIAATLGLDQIPELQKAPETKSGRSILPKNPGEEAGNTQKDWNDSSKENVEETASKVAEPQEQTSMEDSKETSAEADAPGSADPQGQTSSASAEINTFTGNVDDSEDRNTVEVYAPVSSETVDTGVMSVGAGTIDQENAATDAAASMAGDPYYSSGPEGREPEADRAKEQTGTVPLAIAMPNQASIPDISRISTFLSKIQSVETDSPQLLSAIFASANTTVGAIKDAYSIECEYIPELTEEQLV